MRRIGRNFEYQPPDGWSEEVDGTRRIYRSGVNRLIVWSNLVEGNNGEDTYGGMRDRLLQEALQVAQNAALQPGLTLMKALSSDEGLCALPCWTVASRSADGNALFISAVVQGTSGILYATLEAVLEPASLAVMERFLRSVKEPA